MTAYRDSAPTYDPAAEREARDVDDFARRIGGGRYRNINKTKVFLGSSAAYFALAALSPETRAAWIAPALFSLGIGLWAAKQAWEERRRPPARPLQGSARRTPLPPHLPVQPPVVIPPARDDAPPAVSAAEARELAEFARRVGSHDLRGYQYVGRVVTSLLFGALYCMLGIVDSHVRVQFVASGLVFVALAVVSAKRGWKARHA